MQAAQGIEAFKRKVKFLKFGKRKESKRTNQRRSFAMTSIAQNQGKKQKIIRAAQNRFSQSNKSRHSSRKATRKGDHSHQIVPCGLGRRWTKATIITLVTEIIQESRGNNSKKEMPSWISFYSKT